MWFKDAIIYELHVRSFFDSNADGIGDFRGLTSKLDYLSDLGITALWLLPFYPSPLRDDGYDIVDYKAINKSYGTLADFDTFVEAAHKRNLRVITELIVNHTSIDHPWFQASRRAKAGERYRDYYVWSQDKERYKDARIIFQDIERSNWTLDEVRNEHYWHRFFSHQPDLNFENPDVQQEIMDVVDFWLNKGVDGLRLDAVPYLFEKDGTSCENLPQTHAFLKKLRRHVDTHHKDKLLLAEANQWPKTAAAYFGNGDECHMCFHFPLMPRLFMALAQADRQPLDHILAATPEIPENAQWATFLRNHDELTLEMLTDEERILMLGHFAKHLRSPINLGIRHRLAPLLSNDRRQIELMLSLLFTLPGAPVLYYGDELGMGDNIFLNDRDGVRTPMQWSGHKNAGFSTADEKQLFLPPVTSHPYHYETINVNKAVGDPNSLFHFTRGLIAARKRNIALSLGKLRIVEAKNPSVFAFAREHDNSKTLVIANLSSQTQVASLDEVSADQLLLGPYASVTLDQSHSFVATAKGFAHGTHLGHFLDPLVQIQIEAALPNFMKDKRWFSGRLKEISSIQIGDLLYDSQNQDVDQVFCVLASVNFKNGPRETYTIYLAIRNGLLCDAFENETGIGEFFKAAFNNRICSLKHGAISFQGQIDFKFNQTAFKLVRFEQSHSSLVLNDKYFVKVYRKIETGEHPEIELSRFLSDNARFSQTANFVGSLVYTQRGNHTALAAVTEMLPQKFDGFSFGVKHLSSADPQVLESAIRALAKVTGQMHESLASNKEHANFSPESITPFYRDSLTNAIAGKFDFTLRELNRHREKLDFACLKALEELTHHKDLITNRLNDWIGTNMLSPKIRVHGDYHLGQIIVTDDGFSVVDFEGDPTRPLAERRLKRSSLYDVASMICSFDYAAKIAEDVSTWHVDAERIFVEHYYNSFRESDFLKDEQEAILRFLEALIFEKKCREILYELNFRPELVRIPLLSLVERLGITNQLQGDT